MINYPCVAKIDVDGELVVMFNLRHPTASAAVIQQHEEQTLSVLSSNTPNNASSAVSMRTGLNGFSNIRFNLSQVNLALKA